MHTLRFGWCLAVMLAFALCAEVAHAQEEVELSNGSKADWQEKLDAYTKTHRIVSWSIRVENNEPRYDLKMVEGIKVNYEIRTGRNLAAFNELKANYIKQGFVLKKQVEYIIDREKLYAGYWEKPLPE